MRVTWLWIDQMLFGTRQEKNERLRGSLSDFLTCSRGSVAGRPKSSLLCVSVETTKATKRRSDPFFVSFSWEQQVEATLWFCFFTTGAINRWARVASYLTIQAPPTPTWAVTGLASHGPHSYIFHNTCDKKKWHVCVCSVVIFVLALSSRCLPPTLSTLGARLSPKRLEETLDICWRKEENITRWCVYPTCVQNTPICYVSKLFIYNLQTDFMGHMPFIYQTALSAKCLYASHLLEKIIFTFSRWQSGY